MTAFQGLPIFDCQAASRPAYGLLISATETARFRATTGDLSNVSSRSKVTRFASNP
jgi:hypothetical protein